MFLSIIANEKYINAKNQVLFSKIAQKQIFCPKVRQKTLRDPLEPTRMKKLRVRGARK